MYIVSIKYIVNKIQSSNIHNTLNKSNSSIYSSWIDLKIVVYLFDGIELNKKENYW